MTLHVTFVPLNVADMLVASTNVHRYVVEAKVLSIDIPARAYAVSQHVTLIGVELTVGAKLACVLVVVDGSISVPRCAVSPTAIRISTSVRALTVGVMHAGVICALSQNVVDQFLNKSSYLLKSI